MLAAFEDTTNLLSTNSSFESATLQGWTIDAQGLNGGGRIAGDGTHGNQCLELYDSQPTDSNATDTVAYQDYTLTSALSGSTDYTFSAQAKTLNSPSNYHGKNLELDVTCYDTNNAVLASWTNTKDIVYDGQWKKVSYSFTAPSQTKKIRSTLRGKASGRQLIRYDAAQLEQKSLFSTPYTEGTRSLADTKAVYSMYPEVSTTSGSIGTWFCTFGEQDIYLKTRIRPTTGISLCA